MTKHFFDVDDELLKAVRAALGMPTMNEAVREALRRVISDDPGAAYARLIADLAPDDSDRLRREMWSR